MNCGEIARILVLSAVKLCESADTHVVQREVFDDKAVRTSINIICKQKQQRITKTIIFIPEASPFSVVENKTSVSLNLSLYPSHDILPCPFRFRRR